jgi:protein MAK16
MPNRLWHKIRLNSNYSKALDQIDRHLEFWPKFLVHKAKQRLTKIMQYVTRARKLKENSKSNLIINHQKLKRDNKRENKAKMAARCERTIETDIISRLNSGIYGDIYSIPPLKTDILDNSSSHVAHSLACVTSDNERSCINEYDEPEAYLEDLEDTYPTATLEDSVENKIDSGT